MDSNELQTLHYHFDLDNYKKMVSIQKLCVQQIIFENIYVMCNVLLDLSIGTTILTANLCSKGAQFVFLFTI